MYNELVKLAAARIVADELKKESAGIAGMLSKIPKALGYVAAAIGVPMLINKFMPDQATREAQQTQAMNQQLSTNITPVVSAAAQNSGGFMGDIMNSILSNQRDYNSSSSTIQDIQGGQ